MKRIAILVVLLAAAACNKPSEDACKKALLNMQHLLGTDNLSKGADLDAEVRRCRGGSTNTAVDCAAAAQTREALTKCDFYGTARPLPEPETSGSAGSGSAG